MTRCPRCQRVVLATPHLTDDRVCDGVADAPFALDDVGLVLLPFVSPSSADVPDGAPLPDAGAVPFVEVGTGRLIAPDFDGHEFGAHRESPCAKCGTPQSQWIEGGAPCAVTP